MTRHDSLRDDSVLKERGFNRATTTSKLDAL
jgi:hypothetical protein